MTGVRITVSPGELLDRITILEVRLCHMPHNKPALRELRALSETWEKRQRVRGGPGALSNLQAELLNVNAAIWDAEDVIRLCMKAGEFGPMFVRAAREAHEKNDERARLKAEINRLLGAPVEEKSYGESNDKPG